VKFICRLLVVSLLFLSFQSTAAMIGTDQVTAAASSERMQVQNVLARSEVSNALQAMGVDPKMAADRVAALTDDEVRSLNGKLDAVPAGATSSGWWIAAIIVVGVLIWWAMGRR
jgi:hypothetical protein